MILIVFFPFLFVSFLVFVNTFDLLNPVIIIIRTQIEA